jgi:hypothetical protein
MLVLYASPGVPCTKTWSYEAGHFKKISDYPDTYLYGVQTVSVSSIDDVAAVVQHCSGISNSIILRGRLTQRGRDDVDAQRLITRQKQSRDSSEPPIEEWAPTWLMIDIDDFRMRASDDLVNDPTNAIEHAIYNVLPNAFHDVRCFWQLSASCGFAPGILKVHLWYWLSAGVDNITLRRNMVPYVDIAPFSANQPHYIVPPVLVGMNDPLPVRTGWIDGMEDEVDVSAIPVAVHAYLPPSFGGTGSGRYGDDMIKTLETIGDGNMGFHAILRDASHLYNKAINNGELDRDDNTFKELLREFIDNAPKSSTRDPNSITRYQSDRYLDDLIDGSQRKLLSQDSNLQLKHFMIAKRNIQTKI